MEESTILPFLGFMCILDRVPWLKTAESEVIDLKSWQFQELPIHASVMWISMRDSGLSRDGRVTSAFPCFCHLSWKFRYTSCAMGPSHYGKKCSHSSEVRVMIVIFVYLHVNVMPRLSWSLFWRNGLGIWVSEMVQFHYRRAHPFNPPRSLLTYPQIFPKKVSNSIMVKDIYLVISYEYKPNYSSKYWNDIFLAI